MKIVIIGSGNIATSLAKKFHQLNYHILQVYSRTLANAKVLANVVSSEAIDNIDQISYHADLYILAVSDHALSTVINSLSEKISGIVVHTSGATDIQILTKFKNYGVIYPPQSINKSIQTDLASIPFCVEGNNTGNTSKLLSFTHTFAPKAFICNSHQRLALHLSAVFVNNFTNTLFDIAYKIMSNNYLEFSLLHPIILETSKKIINNIPAEIQTGPAARNDLITIKKHLEFLSQSDDLKEIYQVLTDFIIKRHHNS